MTIILFLLSAGFAVYFVSVGMYGAALGAGIVAAMIGVFYLGVL